jgi:hypothetical protein
MRSLKLLGLVALMGASLYGQVYWTTGSAPDCTGTTSGQPIEIVDGTTHVGWSCTMDGVFNWYAAGGAWGTSILGAAPSSGDIGAEIWLYDVQGNDANMDTNYGTGNTLNFSLYADQAAEFQILGAHSNPSHSTLKDGSIWARFYCPDAATCLNLSPQLIYSALPAVPYSLSVPITWEWGVTRWSSVGIDNGGTKLVALVIYNDDYNSTLTATPVHCQCL